MSFILKAERAIQDKFGKVNLILMAGVCLILAIALRVMLFDFETLDYQNFVSHWYDYIKENGFAAFEQGFYNYAPPYLYLLALAVCLPLQKLYAIKLVTILFDILAAFLVYVIIRQKYKSVVIPLAAAVVLLYTPTVFINSAMWGQCDIIFTCGLLASVLFMAKGKYLKAFIFFGIAFSFKLQAVFLFPVFVILYFRRRFPFYYFFIIPITYLLLCIPCLIAGRPFTELLFIYVDQTDIYSWLTINAPNIYQWVSVYSDWINAGAVFLAAAVILFFCFICYRGLRDTEPGNIIRISLISLLIVPYFLPQMHERYFFPADVMSIVYAFYFPKYFYVPILVVMVSYFSYYPYLYPYEPVIGFAYLAIGLLAVIIITVVELYRNGFSVKLEDRLQRED